MGTTSSNAAGVGVQLCRRDGDEEIFFSSILAGPDKLEPCTAYKRVLTHWVETAGMEMVIQDNNARPGATVTFEISKEADAVVGAALIMECPQIGDACRVTGATMTTAARYTVPGNAADAVSTVITITAPAHAGGVAGVATGTFIPARVTFAPVDDLDAGQPIAFHFGGGGFITAVTINGESAIVTGSGGDLTGAILGTHAIVTPGGAGEPVATTIIANGATFVGSYTFTVAAGSSDVDSSAAPQAVENGEVSLGTAAGGAFEAFNTVNLAKDTCDFAFTYTDGVAGASAYYVNGAPLRAIKSMSVKVGSADVVHDLHGQDIRIQEKIRLKEEEVNSGLVGNWGKRAQLQRYAHKLSQHSTATSEIKVQHFLYDFGGISCFRDSHNAVLLNALQGGDVELKLTFEAANTLFRHSTDTTTQQGTVRCLFGNHAASTVGVHSTDDNSKIKFHLLVRYMGMTKDERAKYSQTPHEFIIPTINAGESNAHNITAATSTSSYAKTRVELDDWKHPSRWCVLAIQPAAGNRDTTNGEGDIFTYKVAADKSVGAEASTGQLFGPAIEAVTLHLSAERATHYNWEMSQLDAQRFLPGGKSALDEGLLFYSFAPQDPVGEEYYGHFPMSGVQNPRADVYAQPGLAADAKIFAWMEQNLIVQQSAGNAQKIYH